jgi:hypothetical protein
LPKTIVCDELEEEITTSDEPVAHMHVVFEAAS